jgi:O-antigen ligase
MVGNTVTGTAPIAADWNRGAPRVAAAAPAGTTADAVAFGGMLLLIVAAPFERTQPLVALPGQSISNLEAVLFAVFLAWVAALARSRRLPYWRTRVSAPWIAWVGVLMAASLAAPAFRANALHMTGRMAAAFGVFLLALNGTTTRRRLATGLAVSLAISVAVSVLVVLEYQRVASVIEGLKAFRPFMTMVGAQVRAGGPLQYPTIASMYLEVTCACGIGLMLSAIDANRRRVSAVVFAAVLLAAYAVTLTFTRAGLLALGVIFTLLLSLRYRVRGLEAGGLLIVALAVGTAALLLGSRPIQSLWLRFTSENQNAWYRAAVAAPGPLTMDAGTTASIPLTLTNAGRVPWDSHADMPVFLSYHWMAPDEDRYIVYDGRRTPFAAVVAAGETIAMDAIVRAPADPGAYRLVWDVVLEHRFWFSTEPGAAPAVSQVTVEGGQHHVPAPVVAPPRRVVPIRPGRAVLWTAALRMVAAHPVLGIGPDNFRLSYADYAKLPDIDRRMHSNNMYVETLAGSGLAGALVFVWLIVSTARMTAAGVRRTTGSAQPIAAGIAAAVLAIGIHGLVDSFLSFASTYMVFAITLGLAAACARGLESGGDAYRI